MAMVMLLLFYCLMYFPLFWGDLCLSLICYALLCVHSSFAIILKRKRKLVALLVLSNRCIVTINVPWCHGFVCSVWLWYFLIIFTYFLTKCLELNANIHMFVLTRGNVQNVKHVQKSKRVYTDLAHCNIAQILSITIHAVVRI